MVFEKIVQILAEQLSIDPDKITMDSLLEEDPVSYTHLTLPTKLEV